MTSTPPDDDRASPATGEDMVALSAMTPPDTQNAALPPRGPIIALRVVGRNEQIDLPPERDQLTIGAAGPPTVDVTLAGAKVSRKHALLVRKGPKLQVRDLGSTNGTYFHGFHDSDFEVAAGEIFEMSRNLRLLALDHRLLGLRNRLSWVLGLKEHAAMDAAIEAIASNAPLLLLGPAGCDQIALAQEIHRRSPYADHNFIVAREVRGDRSVRTVTAAQGGTLFLDLAGTDTPPPESFLVRAFAHCRPIFAAPDETRAAAMLEGFNHRCKPVRLVPPCLRPTDIPRLLDALLWQEHETRGAAGLPPSVTALGAANVAGLCAHPWLGHFDDMRADAPRLYAVIAHGGVRAAGRALGVSHTAIRKSLRAIGVFMKRAPGGDDGDEVDEADDELPHPPGAPTRPLRVDKAKQQPAPDAATPRDGPKVSAARPSDSDESGDGDE